jgi:hypothetical protein
MSGLMEQARATRELAQRARRLAEATISAVDKDRLLLHAEELEDQATALERKIGSQP